MPKNQVTYAEIADSLVEGGWYYGDAENVGVVQKIKSLTIEEKIAVLLTDIAKSLRVLRCSNFIDIPRRLNRTRVAVEGLRREARDARKNHRRKL